VVGGRRHPRLPAPDSSASTRRRRPLGAGADVCLIVVDDHDEEEHLEDRARRARAEIVVDVHTTSRLPHRSSGSTGDRLFAAEAEDDE
jgi:hypothetical protein